MCSVARMRSRIMAISSCDVVEGGQLLREVRHRAAMAVALAVQDHLDDRLDLPFHRNQHAGDEQARA